MNQEVKKIRHLAIGILLLSAITGFSSCEKYSYTPPAVDPDATWSLSNDIQPIFSSNCITCHNGSLPLDLREGKSFQSLTSRGDITLPAESSTLYTTMTGSEHAPRSSDADKLKVLYWIQQGALNN